MAATLVLIACVVWSAFLLSETRAQRELQLPASRKLPSECNSNVPCFIKCCPLNQKIVNRECVASEYEFWPYVFNITTEKEMGLLEMENETYYLVIGIPCSGNLVVLPALSFGLWEDGELDEYPHKDGSSLALSSSEYCLDTSVNGTYAVACGDDPYQRASLSWLYAFGLSISVSCLLVTLVIYLAVDSLRDLHGKSLVCHVGCLAVAYALLAGIQISKGNKMSPSCCRSFAFTIQFFLLSSFFWLHIMCLDSLWGVMEAVGVSPVPYPRAKKWRWLPDRKIWITGDEEIDANNEAECKERDKMVERRVFVGYSVYAWLLSLMPVLLVLGKNLCPIIPSTYLDYNMKLHDCISEKNEKTFTSSSIPYFYPLIGFIVFVNLIIFITILILAWPGNFITRWNTAGLQRVPKQKARMCFLLFSIMCSNWTIDLVSWALGGTRIAWIMLHGIYILQGLVTFLIFVLEERVKNRINYKLWPRICEINRKYKCCRKIRHSEEDPEPQESAVMLNTGSPKSTYQ